MIIYSKNIYLEDKKISGFIKIEDKKIIDIAETEEELKRDSLKDYILKNLNWNSDNEILDYTNLTIIPGFIDNHIHGWGTGSFWFEKSKKSITEMQKHLPKEGVTSFLATTGADTTEEILTQIDEASDIYEFEQVGADMIGVHLEGPFISKDYKGMQKEENCILPNLEYMKLFYNRQKSKDLIKLMTMAPELDGAKDVAEFCREKGIQLSIGHTGATFDKIKEMKDCGFGGFTHTFSGMRGMHHRELGVVGAALYFDDMYCEFAKQTGLTVKHEAFDIALRIKTSDKIILSTDCCGLAMTDKPWHHYVRKITIIPQDDGVMIKHDDGREEVIDNSKYENVRDLEMSYIDSVKNVIKHSKVDLFDIMKMASINPAKYINVYDEKGSIAVNKDADLLVIDDDFNLIETIVRGKVY
ncbi:N-acetylglucosamine-6-phosphate deacetylase [Clostridium nigeriense]|uniref:N-acetylglucosamine-6-phosphate deacetylase n=1 Tax=Clostridium nigeriense TaxID=1805470 RepID=UPI00082DD96B|nr:N-acetylglucosamine-6-phosphate deacetylase [Clostridium nigeriense]